MISAGSYTVGATGTYPDWDSAIADVAALLTGDLTLTQISDVSDNIQITATIADLGGFRFLMTSDNPHSGDVNGGWSWDPFGVAMRVICGGSGIFEVENLRVTGIFTTDFQTDVGSTVSLLVHDIIVYGDGVFGNQSILSVKTYAGGVSLYNCLSVNQNYHIVQQVFQIQLQDPTAPIRIFNNVAKPFGVSNQGFLIAPANQVFTDVAIANNIAVLGGTEDGFIYSGGADASLLAGMTNNATTDATTLVGTVNPIHSFIPTTEFTSIDFSNAEYLKPKSTSQFKLAGSSTDNPTTVDITGAAYGANPPIGSYVAVVVIPSLFFRIMQHLWPISLAFDTTEKNKKFTQFNEGLSRIGNNVKTFIDNIYEDLFPQTTRQLNAWEKQWNLTGNATLTEQQRRDRIAGAWRSLGGQSPKYIQDTLQAAGFDVYVHEWWELPAANPPVARNPNTVLAGDSDLLVNIIPFTDKTYITGLGEVLMEANEPTALCGQFTDFVFGEIVYTIPSNPLLWPYFLYIGEATFPNRTNIPLARKEEFRELCLKICPTQQWLGLLIDFV